METDTLTLDLFAGVTTPLARVPRLSTDLTAVAGLLRPTADAAAVTRVVNLRSSTGHAEVCSPGALAILDEALADLALDHCCVFIVGTTISGLSARRC